MAKQDGNSPITTPLNPSQQKENSLAPIVQERQPSQVLQTNVQQQSTSPTALQIPLQQIERILTSLMKQGADGQKEPNLKQLTALLQGLQQAGSQPDAKGAVLQKEFPFLSKKREAKALAQVVQQTEPTLSNKTDVLDLLMTMKKRQLVYVMKSVC
ncbi:hypothetical protein BsIDN1_29290 [Bacillus safensis]|uniref:Uncharacterized protein n=1 Tax=Bacillus safensis TaxID=561879 RepID=A0A5S9M8T2_BACIA|nr:hypothetical protein BsIDN1_29290 [Bacillus safensis]